MDSFLLLYNIYRSVPRWKIALSVYQNASTKIKLLLWSTKVFFAVFIIFHYIFTPNFPYLILIIATALAWGWVFNEAIKSVFSHEYSSYPEQMKYFKRDYQYIRYLQFQEKLSRVAGTQDIKNALAFLSEHIESSSSISVSSHPVIVFLFAVTFAILGGASGQWPINFTVSAIFILLVLIYFSYMILGSLRTKQVDLKEFQRFLLWARDEQLET